MKLPNFLTRDADGFVHVTASRVGLQQLIRDYNEGYSAEMLACEYDSVPPPTIHKALAFYLENQSAVDEYIAACEREFERQRAAAQPGPGIAEMRRRLAARAKVQGA